MWNVEPHDDYEKRRARWPKKYKRELLAMHSNLDTFLTVLNNCQKVEEARFGFIHPEPMGVLAIDQKGGGQSMKETRLYVYPDSQAQILHLVTMGDKDTQVADLEQCRAFIKEHRHPSTTTTREKTHAQE